MFHFLQADILLAQSLADQAVNLAKTLEELEFSLAAQRQLGLVSRFHGEFDFSMTCFGKVTSSCDIDIHGVLAFRRAGADFGVASLATSGFALIPLGYPDRAKNKYAEAVTPAQKLGHPISTACAHYASAFVHLQCGRPEAALEHAAKTMVIAEDKGFSQYIAWATAIRGGVHLDRGAFSESIAEIHKALALDEAIGSRLFGPHWAVNLADVFGRNGGADKGLSVNTEALDHVDRTEEHYPEAELYRIRGELRLLGDTADATDAVVSFQKAIEITRSQRAKTWELRAATSLARLWLEQGKAGDLLRPVYDWFTEGFDTPDLQTANALLDSQT